MRLAASERLKSEKQRGAKAGEILMVIFLFGMVMFSLVFGYYYWEEAAKGEATTDAEIELRTWQRIIEKMGGDLIIK
jgi:hypothetical protein